MARQPRLAAAGELHLLLLRGHSDAPVFADDADRQAFIDLLRDAAMRHEVAIHAYALLTSEVHLLLTPKEANGLGRLVQSLGRRYVAAYNRRHGRRGTLWDGRFRNCLLHAETLLMPATLQVETLPVIAGLAAAAAEWPWSSAAHHTGVRRDPAVTDHPQYWRIGNTPFERERAHTVALAEGPSAKDSAALADATSRSCVLGPPAFVARIADLLDRPLQPRARGRPRRTTTDKPVPI